MDRLHRETILYLPGGEERDHELHLGLPAHPLPRGGEGQGALLWEGWRAPSLGIPVGVKGQMVMVILVPGPAVHQ